MCLISEINLFKNIIEINFCEIQPLVTQPTLCVSVCPLCALFARFNVGRSTGQKTKQQDSSYCGAAKIQGAAMTTIIPIHTLFQVNYKQS